MPEPSPPRASKRPASSSATPTETQHVADATTPSAKPQRVKARRRAKKKVTTSPTTTVAPADPPATHAPAEDAASPPPPLSVSAPADHPRESQLSPTEMPKSQEELKRDLQACVEQTRQAFVQAQRSMFQLGDALIALREAYHRVYHQDLTRNELLWLFELPVSPQRLSQIETTARYFPPVCRDEAIDFKVWETARLANERRQEAKLPVQALVKLVRETGDSKGVRAALDPEAPAAVKRYPPAFELKVRKINPEDTELVFDHRVKWGGESSPTSGEDYRIQLNAASHGVIHAMRALLTELMGSARHQASHMLGRGEISNTDEAWTEAKHQWLVHFGTKLGEILAKTEDADAGEQVNEDIQLILKAFWKAVDPDRPDRDSTT